MVMTTLYAKQKRDTEQYRLLDSVGEGEGRCFERTAWKPVYYLG